MKSWEDHNVYEVVPYNNQKCISVRWVCSLKKNPGGTSKPKARLVARGYEEKNLHTFLQGNKLSRDVYIKPPVEADCEPNFV